MPKLTAAAAAMACALWVAPLAAAQDEPMSHDERMQWWRDARFGMFIHWGVYAVPAGRWEGKTVPSVGEWIMETAKIPVSRYEPLAGQFNPTAYDAREWARIAREAGMKYIVITSKHHDGFALWDSKLSDWDVMRTPMKQDLLAPLAKAARDEGLRFGLYHSIMDWHHPDYAPRRAWHDTATGESDFDRFREYLHGQVQEILTAYQPDILWFDGEWESTWTHEHGRALEQHVRRLKPDILINNRVGKAREGMAGLDKQGMQRLGDFGTPEQEIPSTGIPGVDWESCMTMNDTWGYKVDDVNWKSTGTLIRNLIDCASKGGNYLLNVGPTAEGRIPDASVQRLREIGQWLAINGEAIYGTTAGPFKRLPWGRATRKGDVIYLHVFDWPESGQLLVPLRNTIVHGWLLAEGEETPLAIGDDRPRGALILLPQRMPDERATVIALRIEGEPSAIPLPSASQQPDGTIVLRAADADLDGGLHVEQIGGQANIGFWTNPQGAVSWDVQVNQPGSFDVSIEFACETPSAGSTIHITAGEAAPLQWQVPSTGGWQQFETARPGQLQMASGGIIPVRISARSKPGLAVMNIRRLTLTPRREH